MKPTIGVLALQGAYEKHCEMLKILSIPYLLVKKKEELDLCHALIIPGGESTTLFHLMKTNGFLGAIKKFSKPIFGTCAGMILLSKEVENATYEPLGMIDLSIQRNAYGRQIHSFSTELHLSQDYFSQPFQAVFIRAPLIKKVLSKEVKILSSFNDRPVFVQQNAIFASSFHPELTQDTAIHKIFVDYITTKVLNHV